MKRRGQTLVVALGLSVVIAFITTGICTLTVAHYSRVSTESDYAAALDTAEAGVNYELRKISKGNSQADQLPGGSGQAPSYGIGAGTASIYCTNQDGTTPWNPALGNNLCIIATGTRNGASRTVKVCARGLAWAGNYAVYTLNYISVWNGSAITVNGDVGTNGLLDFTGHPSVIGNVYFNGPNAGWSGGAQSGYNVVTQPSAIPWPTVDQVASQRFPAAIYPPGGLSYLAAHNSNASASPPITNNTISGSTTLVGPGDYYLTNISLSGQQAITFNNSAGPINLWLGPSGGAGQIQFRGGSAAVARSADPAKACTIFCATLGGISLNGNNELDGTVYCYNQTTGENPYTYGTVSFGGNPSIYGQIIGNEVDMNGNISVNYVPGVIMPLSPAYYGYANSWQEIGGANE